MLCSVFVVSGKELSRNAGLLVYHIGPHIFLSVSKRVSDNRKPSFECSPALRIDYRRGREEAFFILLPACGQDRSFCFGSQTGKLFHHLTIVDFILALLDEDCQK